MGKKLGVLAVMLCLMLVMAGSANAGFVVKVDIAKGSTVFTDKGGGIATDGWLAWGNYNDNETHDATAAINIGGTGINVGIGANDGSSNPGTVLNFTTQDDEPICNTWIGSGDEGGGHPDGSIYLILSGPGLLPGIYEVYGYHNSVGGSETNMPNVTAVTASTLNDIPTDNFGYTSDPDGGGVIVESNDVNVPINHFSGAGGDDLLEANRSVVRFSTDGSPVAIQYEAGSGSQAVLNAFIIFQTFTPLNAWKPFPIHEEEYACSETTLSWDLGTYADTHDVYFGTDWDDVNDATTSTAVIFKGNVDPNTYSPGTLDFDTTYYWRVDEVNDVCNPYLWKGFVWEFTTESGKARAPNPSDLAGRQSDGGITLEWTSSCLATSGDYLYFGTDFDDVNNSEVSIQIGPLGTSSYATGPLAFAEKYYWKVNGIGTGTQEGDVWSFQTAGYPLMHFEFEGVLDANIGNVDDANFLTDSTGNVTFNVQGDDGVIKYGESNPLYNTPGTSAQFSPTDEDREFLRRDCFGEDLLDLDGDKYTIQAWVRHDGPAVGIRDGDLEGTIIRKDFDSYGLGIDDDGTIKFMHSGEILSTGPLGIQVTQGEWHHIAAVYDSSTEATTAKENEKIYLDGVLVADNNFVAPNPQDDGDDYVTIGAFGERDATVLRNQNYFNGAIDELHIIDQALKPNEFLIRGDLHLAWLPIPSNGASGINPNTDFTWYPGDYASSHDVYLGNSWDDVNDATTATAGIFKGNFDPNSYDPPDFDLEETYYWRVDEVNDSNGMKWKGSVWRFETAGYLVVEDFESYNQSTNLLLSTWTEYVNAYFELSVPGDPTRPGSDQSALLLYYNDFNYGDGYHSEAGRALGGMDFDKSGDIKSLGLFFYGNALNDAGVGDEPYIGIDDGTTYAESRYTDSNNPISDIQEEEWHEWNVPLSSLSGPTMTSIQNIFIGVGESDVEGGIGEVFFDDIRLSGPKCVLEFGPEWDFSGNCIVDIADIGIMGDEWLRHDVFLAVSAPATAPVAQWDLDDGFFIIEDSVGSNDGVAEGEYSWVAGKVGTDAIEFTGDGGRVRVPHSESLMPDEEVSVTAWICATEEIDGSVRVVAKGVDANDWEAYYIQFTDADHVSWSVRDANHNNHALETDDLNRNEWIHVAGTFDGEVSTLYINGQLDEQNTVEDFVGSLLQDSNDLSIGNASDVNDRAFIGKIDDVRVYGYGLAADEVAYIAAGPTGYVGLESQVNLYNEEPDGEKAVNFRDLAVLMTKWMEEKLYPE